MCDVEGMGRRYPSPCLTPSTPLASWSWCLKQSKVCQANSFFVPLHPFIDCIPYCLKALTDHILHYSRAFYDRHETLSGTNRCWPQDSCCRMHHIATSVQQRIHLSHYPQTAVHCKQKVIGEEGCVAAVSYTYAVKSPLVTLACPKFAAESTPSRGQIPKPHYLSRPCTHPTYDAKRHPVRIRRFSTVHWTDRHTDRQIVHGKVWSL